MCMQRHTSDIMYIALESTSSTCTKLTLIAKVTTTLYALYARSITDFISIRIVSLTMKRRCIWYAVVCTDVCCYVACCYVHACLCICAGLLTFIDKQAREQIRIGEYTPADLCFSLQVCSY
jgi:hypothetical protein